MYPIEARMLEQTHDPNSLLFELFINLICFHACGPLDTSYCPNIYTKIIIKIAIYTEDT